MKKITVIVLTVLVIVGMYRGSPYREERNRQTVSVVQPTVSDIHDTLTLHGIVKDRNRKKEYAKGTSKVLDVYVSEGEMVTSGQNLMKLQCISDPQREAQAAAETLQSVLLLLESGKLEEAEEVLTEISAEKTYYEKSGEVYYLKSKAAGTIMKAAKKGTTVSSLMPCIEISDLKDLEIVANADENNIGKINEGMTCIIQIPAFSVRGFEGSISAVMPYAHQTGFLTGTTVNETEIHILPNSQSAMIRPGYSAKVRVITEEKENALLIPFSCVGQDEMGNEYVYILENGTSVKRNIITGIELEETVEILDGIHENDILIMNPEEIMEGEKVKVALD